MAGLSSAFAVDIGQSGIAAQAQSTHIATIKFQLCRLGIMSMRLLPIIRSRVTYIRAGSIFA
jgi:hypothetical protein